MLRGSYACKKYEPLCLSLCLDASHSVDTLTISVVIPAFNAARTLSQTLSALCATAPLPLEITVVNDGSTDDTARIAEQYGVCVLALEQNIGAAAAKNRGAQQARGEILFFTDADIVVSKDVFARVLEAFHAHNCAGVVGVLDERIPARNWASQFKNLWMNFTYTRLRNMPRIGLFYTSVAAIKRETFLRLGGFDENYRGASIAEDTEFGQRAWAQGIPIVLDADLRVVHLKAYSAGNVLLEDFRRARALTLMRLRKRQSDAFFTSVPFFYQLAVPTIYLVLILFIVAIVFQSVVGSVAGLIALGGFYVLNLPLLAFLWRARGAWFTIESALFLPLDALVVGLGILRAVFDFLRGIRY